MNLYVNLDFEYEYLRGVRPKSRAVQRQNERWSHVMRLMPGFSDAVPRESSHSGAWLPWGVTPSFMALKPRGDFPSCDIVRRVNSKLYSAYLETELSIALPGARIADSLETTRSTVESLEGKALIKNPWGVAGRERITIEGGSLDDESKSWLDRQFKLVDALIVEPLVDRTRDWSLQFDLAAEVHELGACGLVTDAAGNHRGHRIDEAMPPMMIVESAREVAERVHARGYRGPLGIDAFEGRLDGREIVRPLCELNARMTFGRLAFELRTWVGQPFVWWHPPSSYQVDTPEPIEPGVRAGIYRLPEFADPGGKSGTLVAIGDDTPWIS